MANFAEYYTAQKKTYTFKLKIAACELTESDKCNIECCVSKYKKVSLSAFKKTPLQESPLDFPNVKNTEVFIAEVTVEYPITADAFARELAEATGINSQSIAVYNKDDPRDQYSIDHVERSSEDFKKNYEPKLSSVPEFKEEDGMYGEQYNAKFLKSLEDERKQRKVTTVTNDLIPAEKVDNSSAPGPEKGKQNNDSLFNKMKHKDKGRA